ncbi:hypothetical protein Hanom_Chr17g01553291 [Helianthus anomalus]
MSANHGDSSHISTLIKDSCGKLSFMESQRASTMSPCSNRDRWSAATFNAPFLSCISISNSCSNKIHLIRRGLASCLLKRYRMAA